MRHRRSLPGLTKDNIKKMNPFLEVDDNAAAVQPNNFPHPARGDKARCYLCLGRIQAVGMKKKKDNFPNFSSHCQCCGKNTCQDDAIFAYKTCIEKFELRPDADPIPPEREVA